MGFNYTADESFQMGMNSLERKFDEMIERRLAVVEKKLASDVVEVVRCKDCVYYHPSYCEIWSKYGTVQTREPGFCYMAERKGETNG